MKQAAPGAALICLLWLGVLGPAAAQYVPTLTVVRSVDSFHVLQNMNPQNLPIPPSQMLVLLLKWNEFSLRVLTHGKAVGRGSKV